MFFVSFENQDACYSFGETQSADNVGGFYFYFSVGSVPYSPPWKIAVREELVNNYEFDELPLAVIGRPDLRRAGRGGGEGRLARWPNSSIRHSWEIYIPKRRFNRTLWETIPHKAALKYGYHRRSGHYCDEWCVQQARWNHHTIIRRGP